MTYHNPQQVQELFLSARELPSAEREAFVKAHAGDKQLAAEVLSLLQHDLDDEFLERPLVSDVIAGPVKSDAMSEPLDATISVYTSDTQPTELIDSRYKLLQKIGEGGFGIVYMAEQVTPVRRRVALKMLKSSMDTKNILARFASERQALALMDHPHIAKVLDGGFLPDQRPYFVMELVNGLPITNFCDQHNLDQAARMQLLAQVCLAVHHAHQRGIIHRDLKPTNILVSVLDGRPIPKIIDFGIAKALHGPLTEATLFTSFQQMIGTPEYMSPEQAETSLVDADTRSDVYSLGVLAYELLTGVTPLDGATLRQMGFGKLQQTIREYEPVRPSERLQTLVGTGQGISRGNLLPETLRSSLRNELDWVVMKAIEKDRGRRYSSAQAMAEDLQRWISHDPILARPPSVWYLLSKWVRKHALQTAVAAALLLATLIASAGLGYGLSERRTARVRSKLLLEKNQSLQVAADQERERADRLLYGDAMQGAHEAFLAGRRQAALDLLSECPVKLRGDEWRWQSYLMSNRAQRIHQGTPRTGQTTLLALNERKGLISAGQDGIVHHWDPIRGELKHSWKAHAGSITALAASADGARLLTSSSQGELRYWQIENKSLLGEAQLGQSVNVLAILEADPENDAHSALPIAEEQSKSTSMSMQGHQPACIAVARTDGSIVVFRDGLDKPPLKLGDDSIGHTGTIQTLAFESANKLLVSAGKGGVMVWDWKTEQRIRLEGESWQSYGALLTSTNKAVVYGPPVAAVDLAESVTPRIYDLPATGIWSADFCDSQQQLYMVTEEQAIRRLELQSGKHETVGFIHESPITQVRVADDGTWLAALGDEGSLWLLSKTDWSAPQTLDLLQGEASAVTYDHDSRQIWAMGENGTLVGWSPDSEAAASVRHVHEYQGFDLVYSDRLEKLITNGLDTSLKVWSVSQDEPIAQYQLALGARYLALHPDGIHLAGPPPQRLADVADHSLGDVTQPSGNLALWNIATGKVERVFSGLHNWAMKLTFSHDGNLLAAATIGDGVVVWREQPAPPLYFKLAGQHIPVSVAFSPDDRQLLAGYRDGQVHVWDVETQRHLRRMICHGDEISQLLFTPDGNRLITACRSQSSLRIWDWRLGKQVGALDTSLPGVTCLKWAEPGRSLIIGGADGGLRSLRVAP